MYSELSIDLILPSFSTKKRKEYVPLVIPLKKPKLKPQSNHTKQSSTESNEKDQDSALREKSLDSAAARGNFER